MNHHTTQNISAFLTYINGKNKKKISERAQNTPVNSKMSFYKDY